MLPKRHRFVLWCLQLHEKELISTTTHCTAQLHASSQRLDVQATRSSVCGANNTKGTMFGGAATRIPCRPRTRRGRWWWQPCAPAEMIASRHTCAVTGVKGVFEKNPFHALLGVSRRFSSLSHTLCLRMMNRHWPLTINQTITNTNV